MSLYTIADLHLPGKEGSNKSMEIFGSRWIGCVDKLIKNWTAVVDDNDTVVIPANPIKAREIKDAAMRVTASPRKGLGILVSSMRERRPENSTMARRNPSPTPRELTMDWTKS